MSTTGPRPAPLDVAQGAPADVHLQQLVRGFQISRAIYVAVRLGIPDLIADAPRSASELAATTRVRSRRRSRDSCGLSRRSA